MAAAAAFAANLIWKFKCLFSSGVCEDSEVQVVANDLNLSLPAEAPTRGVGFNNLPLELQLHIFSFLYPLELCETVAPVCQEWWRLSTDPALWKYLDIDDIGFFARLLKRGPMLKGPNIETSFSLEEFAVVSQTCPMLKELDLSDSDILLVDDRILTHYVRNCPLIEELYLELNSADEATTNLSVSSIAGLTHLKTLNISGCTLVDNDIQLILEKCRRLECLHLYVGGITDKSVCKIENLKTTLKEFAIGAEMLTDLAFQKIGLCTKLQHIAISCGYKLTDQTLDHLKKLTGLNSLDFRALTSMTTVAINDFFTEPCVHNLAQLWIYFTSISDQGVYNITQHCKLLNTLGLYQCNAITEVGLEHIVNHCHNLVSLHLSRLYEITGLCLHSVGLPQKLTFLKLLEMMDCKGIINAKSILVEIRARVPLLEVHVTNSD